MSDLRKVIQGHLKDRILTRNIRDVLVNQFGVNKAKANGMIKQERKKMGIEGRR